MALLFERVFLFIMIKLKSDNAVLVEWFLRKRGVEVFASGEYQWCTLDALYSEFVVDTTISGSANKVKIKEFQSCLKGLGFSIIKEKVCFCVKGDFVDVFKYTPEFKMYQDSEDDVKLRRGLVTICEAISFIKSLNSPDGKRLKKIRSEFGTHLSIFTGAEYRKPKNTQREQLDKDSVKRFIEDRCCDVNGNSHIGSSDIYFEYVKWCVDTRPMTLQLFGSVLGKIGISKKRLGRGMVYFLQLKQ